jgi:hypothetical protein
MGSLFKYWLLQPFPVAGLFNPHQQIQPCSPWVPCQLLSKISVRNLGSVTCWLRVHQLGVVPSHMAWITEPTYFPFPGSPIFLHLHLFLWEPLVLKPHL